MIDFDYPSQKAGLRVREGPTLLDTCVIQNLRALGTYGEDGRLTADGALVLLSRFGARYTDELVALDCLVGAYGRNGPPWVVSESSLLELDKAGGTKGWELRQWWFEWADYFQGCLHAEWYPDLDLRGLVVNQGPEPGEGQLALPIAPRAAALSGDRVPSFGPFRDAGDRALIRDAMRAGIPTILTTDLRSFWANRRALYPFGIEIWRPSDLWRIIARDHAIPFSDGREVVSRS
jgi:hypothetical protein